MTDNQPSDKDKMMDFLETAEDMLATFTGMKASLISKGWSPDAAEQMVIAMINRQ